MAVFKIFINFKTYLSGTGGNAVKLARICKEVSSFAKASEDKQEIEIIPIVQAVDIFRVRQSVEIPVWTQHVDWQEQGKFTGWTNLEVVVESGASGTLLNHSEHQIPPGTTKQILARCKDVNPPAGEAGLQRSKDWNFETMVCCKTLGQMERLVKLKPNFIGYEISELIGTENSITDNIDPKTVKNALKICGEIPLILGAGVNSADDLKKAKDWGAKGVLISSAILLAKNPKDKLEEIIKLVK